MTESIQSAAVIGAGVMGAAIAAHLAGAGVRVQLLDIVPADVEGADSRARSRLAQQGLERTLKAKPAAFYEPDAARLVTVGNLEDDLERLTAAQLVIEAVPEDLGIKQRLFERIAPFIAESAVLATNTSGLSLARMNESLPEELRSRFLAMHFFNPVRYMRLLEVVPGPNTDPELLSRMVRFGEFLGKGVVTGKDTTNFIANRIGVHSMMVVMHEMLDAGLSIEQADAITGKPLSRPKTGSFKLADIVGLDTLVHVAKNCLDSLPDDPERPVFQMPEFVLNLVKAGRLGRKTGAGFYTKNRDVVTVLDIPSGAYRAPEDVAFGSLATLKGSLPPGERIRSFLAGTDLAATFGFKIVARTLSYAAHLVGEISEDVVAIDRAMRWGFNWELGPFEAWDALGVSATVERMRASGTAVPAWVEAMLESGRSSFYEGEGKHRQYFDVKSKQGVLMPAHPRQLLVSDAKRASRGVIRENAGATLVDLGDGILGVELHTKLNTIDADVIEMLHAAVDVAEGVFDAIVVANDAEHFSAGANLMMIGAAAQAQAWDKIDRIIAGLQDSFQRLKYASVPVVTVPCQYTLGGGAELAMAADASQAYAETYMGLVEVGVGLIPAGCGCLRMVERYTSQLMDIEGVDLLPHVARASLNIAMAKVSTSAEDARGLRYLRPTDGISLNRDFLLFEAKQRALGLAGAGYRAPRPLLLKAAGFDAAKTIEAKIWGMVEGGYASSHDALIASKVARILCGGTVAAGTVLSEQDYLDLEREAFLQLCGEPKTQERVGHMLKTGKPLRN